jgi:hypothetical protein
MIPSELYQQMSEDGRKAWASLSDDDQLLILERASSMTSLLTESIGSQRGRGRGTFAKQRDKLRASLHDLGAIDDTLNATVTTEANTGEEDLINSICDTFDIDFETL